MIRDGGILTALDPKTGEPAKVGRLADAPGSYYSSPIAAGGRIYTLSEEGKLSVIRAGRDWEVLATYDFNESCHATPAIADGKMFVRTHSMLYCFARND
jgi:hypothetical protein